MSFYFYPGAEQTSNWNSSTIAFKTIHLNQPKSADWNFVRRHTIKNKHGLSYIISPHPRFSKIIYKMTIKANTIEEVQFKGLVQLNLPASPDSCRRPAWWWPRSWCWSSPAMSSFVTSSSTSARRRPTTPARCQAGCPTENAIKETFYFWLI